MRSKIKSEKRLNDVKKKKKPQRVVIRRSVSPVDLLEKKNLIPVVVCVASYEKSSRPYLKMRYALRSLSDFIFFREI